MPVPVKALSIANIIVGILLCVGGFILTELMLSLRETADKLRAADAALSAQIAALQVLAVTREEFRAEINRLRDEIRQRK